ncbi:MAG TPA: AgmX/PglI C-terminal domain-containing protein [Polyangia bacterium]|jgi:hypothetical protein|nr:AgmX/PglI C-terminal domain-containing protein [Polyangia bacterium]
MKLGRVVWSKWGAPLVFTLGLAAPVMAAPADLPVPPPVTDPSPSGLVSLPSLYETGKVGVRTEGAPTPEPTPVPQELQWAGDSEKSIKTVAADIADAPPPRPPEGIIDPARLDREIGANFDALENCRLDVARVKRIAPDKVVADQLILRWTIDPSGQTSSTDVVATTQVDLDVMDCVKSAMSRWSFTRPRGGAIRLERPFTFRRIP